MKQTLQLKLSQHLALTPQLQQSIRLLQLSTLELNSEIERALQENPLLERADAESEGFAPAAEGSVAGETTAAQGDEAPAAFEEGAALDWFSEAGTSEARDEDERGDYADVGAAHTNLRDHLIAQLAFVPLDVRDRNLVRVLIEALDDDGYLDQGIEELVAMLPAELAVAPEELQAALYHLQHFDPAGVGARSCQECLALQLRSREPSPSRELALRIVEEHLHQLAQHDFAKLRKTLDCSDEDLREAHRVILSLDPRPGARFTPADPRYVIPDVIVRKTGASWVCTLNPDALPRLRVNRLYADLMRRERSAGSLAGHLQEAKWLIRNVQQRFDTILRVSQAIVGRQRQFFDHGEVAMRPLTLREIADEVGLHESTISRVTTQKYVASPRGIFELKYFFGSHVSTEAGGACSATAIRALIRQMVDAEDTHHPLSDATLAQILGAQGIVVARRTVAKYRELLGIAPVHMRKSL
ncbi:MAG TPA: RNA polymerase factor sigma-54 [Rhodocyclaceae bacterium]|nr:MAG: RNA polymerase factor sigma-54 [Rhodocyclales bacterium CG_4_10_14_3_um_filter_68_10]PJA58840.1 MAG: RNA polymerase factor sigma-54 [Rhodocyclales bacterium CG_4_9_14_3_um_filter_68_10]HCX32314.1 RNA polymerase factor sigma-54 [Rhodocyclaceae bacterium]